MCLTPPAAAEGQVSVDVSLNGGRFHGRGARLLVRGAARDHCAPSPSRGGRGPVGTAGNGDRARGSTPRAGCGASSGPPREARPRSRLGRGRLRCIAPPHAAGQRVGGARRARAGGLRPRRRTPTRRRPTCARSPRAPATSRAGALVTLFGANFDPSGANACVFGAAATAAARAGPRTRALCRVPGADAPGEVGSGDAAVDSGDAGATGQGVRFTFTARAPGVQIEPSLGPTSGGTVLSVRGARFAVGARCVLAGRVCAARASNARLVDAAAVRDAAGARPPLLVLSGHAVSLAPY